MILENVLPYGVFFNPAQSDTGCTAVHRYYKYGPTPGNPTPHWYDFSYDGTTGAQSNGSRVTLHFVDGARGNDDLTANGVIVDPGGPTGFPYAEYLPAIQR